LAALDDLDKRLRGLGRTRTRLEGLHNKRIIPRRDLERVYEGLYISAVTSFEDFFEALFFELMLKSEARGSRIMPRAQFKSASVLRDFVLGGRKYVNWLPFSWTEKRAHVYLRGGEPFVQLNAFDKRHMNDWMIIRNAIAHTGREARRRFTRDVLAGIPLPPRERTPAGYLRSELRPGTTRFENITSEMLVVGAKLR
jgi:hypothetical protein